MDILSAIVQGIIQGLTEFLPVSSSGHLTITQHVLECRKIIYSSLLCFISVRLRLLLPYISSL